MKQLKLLRLQIIIILIVGIWLLSYGPGVFLEYHHITARYHYYFHASYDQKQEINNKDLNFIPLYTTIVDYISSVRINNGK